MSVVTCILATIVLALGISFYGQRAVNAHVAKLSEAQKSLFIDHISQDILTGVYSEVHRKCELFYGANGIAEIDVRLSDGQILCSFHGDRRTAHSQRFSGNVYFDESRLKPAASVTISTYDVKLVDFFPSAFQWSFSLAGGAALILSLLNYLTLSMTFTAWMASLRKLVSADEITTELIDSLEGGNSLFRIREGSDVISQFRRLGQTIIQQQHRLIEANKASARADLATQVSHDIRSPLTALNMIVASLESLPEDKRVLISHVAQRINDIANGLLRRNPESEMPRALAPSTEPIMLVTVLNTIVSEKRAQYRDRFHIRIVSELADGYGLFALVDEIEFGRIVSNLINNSVDALKGSGQVRVRISSQRETVVIDVIDDGIGIPADVLPYIGSRGFSHNKSDLTGESGSGLGVYYAKEILRSLNGDLKVESTEGQGTRVSIILRQAPVPAWFVESLEIRPGMKIVTVDDDPTIHQIWAERLVPFGSSCVHITFSAVEHAKDYISSQSVANHLFLIDYEFTGQAGTGLDLIGECQIENEAVLITSRFDDDGVRSSASQRGIRIIPKPLSPFVPMKLVQPKLRFDAVLIDNDPLVIATWEMSSKLNSRSFLAFSRAEDFLERSGDFDPLTRVFVDVELGNSVRGENVAADIAKKGFTEIFLATGHGPNAIVKPSCVRAVVGKAPPFELLI